MTAIATWKNKVHAAENGGNYPRWFEAILDIGVTGTIAQNNTVQLLDCIGTVVVHAVVWEILTEFTASVDFSIGKATGTELSTGFNADQAAGTQGVGTNTVPVLFKNDTVDVAILNAGAAAGKARFSFLVSDLAVPILTTQQVP